MEFASSKNFMDEKIMNILNLSVEQYDKLLNKYHKNGLYDLSNDDILYNIGNPYVSCRDLNDILSNNELILSEKAIDISNNYLGDEGVCKLADYLYYNKNLKYLSIRNNNVNKNGIKKFLTIIMDRMGKKNIPYVDIRGNWYSNSMNDNIFISQINPDIPCGNACIQEVLNTLSSEQLAEFNKKIIWYGKEKFDWEKIINEH